MNNFCRMSLLWRTSCWTHSCQHPDCLWGHTKDLVCPCHHWKIIQLFFHLCLRAHANLILISDFIWILTQMMMFHLLLWISRCLTLWRRCMMRRKKSLQRDASRNQDLKLRWKGWDRSSLLEKCIRKFIGSSISTTLGEFKEIKIQILCTSSLTWIILKQSRNGY